MSTSGSDQLRRSVDEELIIKTYCPTCLHIMRKDNMKMHMKQHEKDGKFQNQPIHFSMARIASSNTSLYTDHTSVCQVSTSGSVST